MPTWVITGSNRGLGLEFVRQLTTSTTSTEPNTILALVRSLTKTDVTALEKLRSNATNGHTLIIHECNTSSAASIASFASTLKSSSSPPKITHLINNAGINAVSQQSALHIQPDDMHAHIDTNVLGPILLTQHLFPLLAQGAVVLNMTSGLGSFGRAIASTASVYGISKAALNMWSTHLAREKEVVERGIRVLVMDPGWVKTDMGGRNAVVEQEASIGGMLRVVEELAGDERTVGEARYRQFDGGVVPW